MEGFKVENLSFSYPDKEEKALENINFEAKNGEFILLCGKSGCGKTTLLRMLKPSVAPFGKTEGKILFEGKALFEYDEKYCAEKIGFVMQNPDNQIVTDKVWHELSFGLESLGYSNSEIRMRVSEMAAFFGIENWFYKKTTELSGGQKQLLNLASVMAMQPSVLILDEPTSQLDPIAAQDFLKTVEKINRDLGTTVIICEHRLDEVFPMAHRVIVMDGGKIISDCDPKKTGKILKNINHEMYSALPVPMRVIGALDENADYPITVCDGRRYLEEFAKKNSVNSNVIPKDKECGGINVIDVKDVWFRYEKNAPDVIKGLNLSVKKGEIFAITGGNGSGKTTALSLISGINKPYRGKIFINGEEISKICNLYDKILGVLPQNPQSLFVKKTVYLDLKYSLSEKNLSVAEKEEKIKKVSQLCGIDKLLQSHPYDLSGGEQQRAALAAVLLKNPEILILDEPTKGLDAHFKAEFAEILNKLKKSGVTILMVSHDIEFCAEYADRCAMFFDGKITSLGGARSFFCGKSFYTTAANRMARTTIPNAVLAEDIIIACGKAVEKHTSKKELPFTEQSNSSNESYEKTNITKKSDKNKFKISIFKAIIGCAFSLLFVITTLAALGKVKMPIFLKNGFISGEMLQIISLIEAAIAIFCFFPKISFDVKSRVKSRKISKRGIAAIILALIAVPITIYCGIHFLNDRKYYFISLMIIFETFIPFFAIFEGRKPATREIVVISVICAIAVAGRAAFFMLPQFKPIAAVVIISAVCFGGEVGFLTGAVSAFVSNFFFGQGPWTPWQMFAFGLIGLVAGIMFKKRFLKISRISLCIFGFFSVLIIYGGILNLSTFAMTQESLTKNAVLSAYIMGFPFDLVHAFSTSFFLWFIAEPMIEKIERIKIKYGFLE